MKFKKPKNPICSKKINYTMTRKKLIIGILVSFLFGYFHFKHVDILFENDKHFSHLSNLERELSFRTESALYYFYFKNLVVNDQMNNMDKSLSVLLNKIVLNDNRTEFPNMINSLQRFNLYPEIAIAVLYRSLHKFNFLSKLCWQVNREDYLPPIESCEGLEEPIYFYSKSVFILHGLLMIFLFWLSWSINNESILSGIIACLSYFYNHEEATRVMWVPALRESFSFPFHLLQLWSLVSFLKVPSKKNQFFLIISSLMYLLPWQFSQFSLATQMTALFLVYSLGFVEFYTFFKFHLSIFLSLIICYVLMFANRMLLTSILFSILFSIFVITLFEKLFFRKKINNIFLIIFLTLVKIFLIFILMIGFKRITNHLLSIQDDSHIWDIFLSKIDNSRHTFDTRLYTCAKEFDFLELSTMFKVTKTLLFPITIINFIFYTFLFGKKILKKESLTANDGIIFYLMFQLIAYSFIAAMIMRLKLFWTPFLCIFSSLIAHKNSDMNPVIYFLKLFNSTRLKYAILFGILSVMSFQGIANLKKQHTMIGEYSNYNLEATMNWINENTHLDDVFSGSMPLMANVKLSTNRPVTNHPHYEDIDLRMRVRKLYSLLYGFRPVEELYKFLKFKLKTKYLIIEKHYCLSALPDKPECAMSAIAHVNGLKKTAKVQACILILNQNEYSIKFFRKSFERAHVFIFKVI